MPIEPWESVVFVHQSNPPVTRKMVEAGSALLLRMGYGGTRGCLGRLSTTQELDVRRREARKPLTYTPSQQP